jgi:glycosyltransferase involved in cell wall biosynthesis
MIWLYLDRLDGGGVAKIHTTIARHLGDRRAWRLVLNQPVDPSHVPLTEGFAPPAIAPPGLFARFRALRRLLADDPRPTLFVGNGREAIVATLLARVRPGLRVVYVQHVDVRLNDVGPLRNIARAVAFAVPSVLVDELVVVSDGLKEAIVRRYPWLNRRIRRIYNPVLDVADLEPPPVWPRPAEYENDRINLVTVGRLSHQKGYDFLIEACRVLHRRQPDRYCVHVLGDGEARIALERARREAGLDVVLHFHGWRKDPRPYMQHADAYLLHSRWEGLPTVLIEACAYAQRIVAFDCPHGVREILADHPSARVVDRYDPVIFASAIESVTGRPPGRASRDHLARFALRDALLQYAPLLLVDGTAR